MLGVGLTDYEILSLRAARWDELHLGARRRRRRPSGSRPNAAAHVTAERIVQ